jgi:hypothetical protein
MFTSFYITRFSCLWLTYIDAAFVMVAFLCFYNEHVVKVNVELVPVRNEGSRHEGMWRGRSGGVPPHYYSRYEMEVKSVSFPARFTRSTHATGC